MNQSTTEPASNDSVAKPRSTGALVALFWLFVGIPLTWGVYNTLVQAMQLFE